MRRLVLRSEGACLIFVWSSDARQLDAVREQLDGRLRASARRVHDIPLRIDAEGDSVADIAQPWLQQVLEPGPGDERNAVWLQILAPAVIAPAKAEHRVLEYLLARLNERRAQALSHPRALIFAGSPGLDALVAAVSPDLWSMRSLSLTLPVADSRIESSAPRITEVYPSAKPSASLSLRRQEAAWKQAWATYRRRRKKTKGRIGKKGDTRINIHMGFALAQEALREQKPALAQRVLEQISQVLGPMPDDHAEQRLVESSFYAHWTYRMLSGDIQRAFGRWDAARGHYERCLQLSERWMALAEDNPTPRAFWAIVGSLEKLGDLQNALGHLEVARGLYERSLRMTEHWMDVSSGSADALRGLSIALLKLGDLEQSLHQWDAARGYYERALQLREQSAGSSNASLEAMGDLSVCVERLGDVYEALGHWNAAQRYYELSLQWREQLVGQGDASAETSLLLTVSLIKLGGAHQRLDRWDLARSYYERSLALCEQLVEETGSSAVALRSLSVSLIKLGEVEQAETHWDPAQAYFRRALQLREQLIPLSGASLASVRDLSVAHLKLGDIQLARGQKEAARDHYDRSRELQEKLVVQTADSPQALRDLSVSLQKLGRACRSLGDEEGASQCYRRSLNLSERLVQITHSSPQALRDLAVILALIGDTHAGDAARDAYERSLRLFEQLAALTDRSPPALRDWAVALIQVTRCYDPSDNRELPRIPRDWLTDALAQARSRPDDQNLADNLQNLLDTLDASDTSDS